MLATKSDPKALDAGVDSLDGTELNTHVLPISYTRSY